MFGSNKNKEESGSPTTSSSSSGSSLQINSLVKGTHVEGTINADTDIRIDGILKGKLTCKSKVIIGPEGFVDGEVRCTNAVIEGKFQGTLHVSELLTVKDNAKVNGDINANKLAIQAGAVFNVSCKMGDESGRNTINSRKEETAQTSVKA